MTEETPIQDKDGFGFPTETQANNSMPDQYSREWGWHEADVDIADQAYRNARQDLIYLADSYTEGLPEPVQTELQDFNEDRYEVRKKKNYRPAQEDDQVLHKTMEWEEAKTFLDAKAGQ